MTMQNNIFLGGADPLLGNTNYNNIDSQIAELQRMQQALEVQKQNMLASQQQMSQPTNQTPIWDEIEKLTSELSDKEFEAISKSEEFRDSEQKIAKLITTEQMKMIRPMIERSQEGRSALESHLVLLKQLKKSVAKEAEKNLELFNEYLATNPDISYKEFLQTKRR